MTATGGLTASRSSWRDKHRGRILTFFNSAIGMLWDPSVTPSYKNQPPENRSSRHISSVPAQRLRKMGSVAKVKSSTTIQVFSDMTLCVWLPISLSPRLIKIVLKR